MVDTLLKIDKDLYAPFVVQDGNEKVLLLALLKALYGSLSFSESLLLLDWSVEAPLSSLVSSLLVLVLKVSIKSCLLSSLEWPPSRSNLEIFEISLAVEKIIAWIIYRMASGLSTECGRTSQQNTMRPRFDRGIMKLLCMHWQFHDSD